ncbi:MAG: hypothetical protein MRY64_14450 [Hyphomonadaceae bacterium]|nr:hypothetical protein [Hyphomonadaceae bacterium]
MGLFVEFIRRGLACAAVLSLAGLTACGGSEDANDPFAKLDDELLVRFSENPDAIGDLCQPFAEFAVRSTEEAFPIAVTFLVDQASFSSAAFALRSEGDPEVLIGMMVLNEAGHVRRPCAEMELQVDSLICKDPEEYQPRPCPEIRFEGEEMFNLFRDGPG